MSIVAKVHDGKTPLSQYGLKVRNLTWGVDFPVTLCIAEWKLTGPPGAGGTHMINCEFTKHPFDNSTWVVYVADANGKQLSPEVQLQTNLADRRYLFLEFIEQK